MICEKKYGRSVIKPMAQKFRRLINLWYYNGAPTHPPEVFSKQIFAVEQSLFTVMEDTNCMMSAAPPAQTPLPSEPATKEDVREIVEDTVGKTADSAADKVVAAVEKGTEKVAKAVRKTKIKGRKPKTKVDVQEAVWNIHERVKSLQAVKDLHPRGIATKGNEFLYAKAELATYGINDIKQYNAAIKARIKHHSHEACSRTRKKQGT